MDRRNFMKGLVSATGMTCLPKSLYAINNTSKRISLETPFDGAVIHERSGFPVKEVVYQNQKAVRLKIEVRGKVAYDSTSIIKIINEKRPSENITVSVKYGVFSGTIFLMDQLTVLSVTLYDDQGTQLETMRVRVIWMKKTRRRFRCFIDDNIYCLRELQNKGGKDLFESDYMKHLREFHRKYGVKFMLNMFYTTPEKDFTLSDFSDRYRSQWRDNSDWLRLAFHAREEFPDRSFLTMSRVQLERDIDQIEREIVRFAGRESLAPTTCLHWGAIDRDNLVLFTRRGTKVFCNGVWALSMPEFLDKYQVPREALYYLSRNDAWYDQEHGLLFASGEVCCNVLENTPERLTALLKTASEDKNVSELLSIMTHEPYFWPFYKGYIPDHWKRFDASFRFVTEHGYQPSFPQDEYFSELVDDLRKEIPPEKV